MLFYRAWVDRPAAAVGVSLSPVRPVAGASPAGLCGRVRVVVRYGDPSGRVGVHRGWLHTDLAPGRRLRLAGCQAEGESLLLSLGTMPARAGRERLTDRFRLPFQLTAWGVEGVAGVRVELFCIPSVGPGFLLLRGRAAVTLEAPAARLVRVVSFCRRLAVDLNPHLCWRAFAAVEGLDLRVGPEGAVEGWLHVAVACRGEPEAAPDAGRPGMGGGGAGGRDVAQAGPVEPAAVRRVDAAVARLEANVIRDGLALVSGAVALDVAWADRSGRGRWTGREVPFSALMEIPGLREGDRLEPVAQVERLTRAGAGGDLRAHLLLGLGLTALRPVHRKLGGDWYRLEQVVGQAVATVELDEPLFPREDAAPPVEPWRRVRLDTGLAHTGGLAHTCTPGPWTALRARIRRAGGRAFLEIRGEPFGAGRAASARAGHDAPVKAMRTAPVTARVELPGGVDAQISLAAVGARAEVRARRVPEGGVEVSLPRTGAAGNWHALGEPGHRVLDAVPCGNGLRCLLRCPGGLRHVTLTPGAGGGEAEGRGAPPAVWTVAGTAVRGLGMDRLWVEVGGGRELGS